MRTILLLFLLSFQLLHAQQKLPTYAIRTQYQIDAIRDTLGPKAGGIVNPDGQVYKDSVMFHYNTFGQLEREQVFRTSIWYSAGAIFITYVDDSSYYYRQHRYNGQGRKVSVRHYTINGNMFSLEYGMHYLMRIDSMAYDSHGAQLFTRRYEPYDFDRGNLAMVVKTTGNEGYEYEYDYDDLGRVYKERRYIWSVDPITKIATRIPWGYDGVNPIEFTYFYQGNTNKIRVRRYNWYYTSGPGVYASRDSLFRYDAKGRIVRFNRYPYVERFQPVSYQKIYGIDSTFYYDNNNSYQKGSNRGTNESTSCDGVAFDSLGRLKYIFRNKFQMQLDGIPSSYLCGDDSFTVMGTVKHYVDSPGGTLLAQDSAYLNQSGLGGTFAFDTISYHGFVDAPLAIEKLLNKNTENVSFAYYPNPAQDYVAFQGKRGNVLHVYDMYGMLQMSIPILHETQKIDIAELPKGTYLLQYGGLTKKLIKQ